MGCRHTLLSSRLPKRGASVDFGSTEWWLWDVGAGVDVFAGVSGFDSWGASFFGAGGETATSWFSSFFGLGSDDVGCLSVAGALGSEPPCSF